MHYLQYFQYFCFHEGWTVMMNFMYDGFRVTNNPYLICIEVDDAAWSTINWTDIDNTASFSENCTVGVNDLNNSALIVYPNPATNTLTMETETAQGIYQLQDITGKVLLNGNVTATKFSLDISALSKGIYLLSLIDGERVGHKKIVKE